MSDSCGLVYGQVSMMGWKRMMEDAMVVGRLRIWAEDYSYFVVFDGQEGPKVGEKCRIRLQRCLEKQIEKWKMWTMEETFRAMGKETIADQAQPMIARLGTVVVLVSEKEVVVANCRDSGVVLCRDGVSTPLCRNHTSSRPDHEKKAKVEADEATILNCNICTQGDLPTSRTLGDQSTCKMEMTVIRRKECDEFLIIATNGLWDVVPVEIASGIVQKCLNGEQRRRPHLNSASEASAALAQIAFGEGSGDNISIIVVQLK